MKYLIIPFGIMIVVIIYVMFFMKSKQPEALLGQTENSPQPSENKIGGMISGGGMGWTEKIKVDNPDGTYTYKYKDHNEMVIASGSDGKY